MIRVTLSPEEMKRAAAIGCARVINNIENNRRLLRRGSDMDGVWGRHIYGAMTEMVFAKHLRAHWDGNIGNLLAADVGETEIRATALDTGCLILHKEDQDDRAFVLVTGSAPSFMIRGWIWARDGKRDEFWLERVIGRPAYFVPQSRLRSITRENAHAAR